MAKPREAPKFKEVQAELQSKWSIFQESLRYPLSKPALSPLAIFPLIGGFAGAENWWGKVLIAAAGTILIYFLVVGYHFLRSLFARHKAIKRESAYGYLLVALKRCFDSLHTAYANDGIVDDKEFVEIMQTFCEAIYEFYSYKTQSKVSVSVKLYQPGSTEYLYTPARNEKAKKRYETKAFNSYGHKVQNNTAFVHVVSLLDTKRDTKEPQLFYLNTCIQEDFLSQKYQSSSIDYLRKHENNQDAYPLGYGSEFVIPILPPFNEFGKPGSGAQMAGFLCIDVAEANTRIFETGYEYETLLGVGHAIYLLGVMINKKK